MFQILVVEDDSALNKTVCTFLNGNGHRATGVLEVMDAYDEMYENKFDLVISDIMMPGMDGFESKRKGFRLGIDDYMVKPIDLEELLWRIEALLRRAKIATSKKLEIGSLKLDAEERTAYVGKTREKNFRWHE